jgi:hypothetical protein
MPKKARSRAARKNGLRQGEGNQLSSLLEPEAVKLLTGRGVDLIQQVGLDVIRGKRWYMGTIIIVDRLGKNSRVERLAHEKGGDVVQMSAAFWPQAVANLLKEKLGYEHKLATIEQAKIEDFLREKLRNVPIESFIRNLPVDELIQQSQLSLEFPDEVDDE